MHRIPYKPWEEFDMIWRRDFLGFQFGAGTHKQQSLLNMHLCMIPYWLIVIPLTLLSAFFLLSKPRKSTSMKITDSILEKVA